MSDDEDAHSEAGPEGWSAKFDQLVKRTGAHGSTPSKPRRRGSKADATDSGGSWFSTLFGATAQPSKKPPVVGSPPESEEEEESIKNIQSSVNSSSEESSENDDVDIEAVDANKVDESDEEEPDTELSRVSTERHSVDLQIDEELFQQGLKELSMGPSTVPQLDPSPSVTSPRRNRMRAGMEFKINQTAAELAEKDPADPQPSSSTEGGWWSGVFGQPSLVDPVPPVAVMEPAKQGPPPAESVVVSSSDNAPENNAPSPPSGGGWTSYFVSTKEAEAPVTDPRAMLPQIPLPPRIDALSEVNSYFSAQRPVPSAEIFGPRPLGRFDGKVRGWPRQFAPSYSSDPSGRPATNFHNPSTDPRFNGVSALAMFRVT